MPTSRQHDTRFFVYIVESPSAPDLYHGRFEGSLVAQALKLNRIPCVARIAISRDAFYAALIHGVSDAMKALPGHLPVLHFSAHGSTDGLQLSNGEFIAWEELRNLLMPINCSLPLGVLVCMSTCNGFHACQMAMTLEQAPHPFFATVGSTGTPSWSDTAVSYFTFYHLFAKGFTIRDAVDRMNVASGEGSWVVQTADDAKQSYLDFCRNADADEVRQSLDRAAEHAELPPDVKTLGAMVPAEAENGDRSSD